MRRPGRKSGIWAVTALFAAIGAALWLAGESGLGAYSSHLHVPWWVLAAMFAFAEINVIHIQPRRETQTFSFSEIPIVLGLFFSSPAELIVGQVLGAGIALIVHRRQPAVKWTFNLAQLWASVALAVVAFRVLARPDGVLGGAEIAAAFAATGVAIATGVLAVMAALTVTEGVPGGRTFFRHAWFGVLGTLTNTSLALMAVTLLRQDARTGWLLIVPVVAFYFAYRGYASHRMQHETLSTFSEATRTVQSSLDLEPAMRTVLERAREIFRADIAYATFLPQEPGEPAIQARIGFEGQEEVLATVEADPTEGIWARVLAEGRGVVLPGPIGNERLHEHFAAQGIRDVVCAPLIGRDGAIGTMTIANRRGDVATFTEDDLRLFEAFVSHIGSALENVRLVARLQMSLGDATVRDQLKDEFLGTLSHELRGPITSMMANIAMLQAGDLTSEEAGAGLETVANQAQHLRALVEDLLMDVRLSGNAVTPVPMTIRVSDLLDRVAAASRPWARNHRIVCQEFGEIPPMMTDPDMVHRILTNLVGNAAKNSPDGSTVTISARRDADSVVFTVEDEGVGIPREIQERIFERFFHLDRTPGRGRTGMGLGLSICMRLAGVLGGRVWLARSEPGAGSEFALRVPLRVVADAAVHVSGGAFPSAPSHTLN
ncbi:MAG TPA: GAF domain-containing sensor histidine kinase [Actinomycetota bacterium]|nr:GAF domain-containing sensor histidine kinase [Actinomycetota bacterium]